jgi:transcription termination factor Rho
MPQTTKRSSARQTAEAAAAQENQTAETPSEVAPEATPQAAVATEAPPPPAEQAAAPAPAPARPERTERPERGNRERGDREKGERGERPPRPEAPSRQDPAPRPADGAGRPDGGQRQDAPRPEGQQRQQDQRQDQRRGQGLNITELKDKSIQQLTQIAKDLNVAGATGMRKQELIFQILKAQTEQSGFIFSEGVLEVLPDGFGFLRAPDYNYLPGPDDIYVSPSQIRKFDLQTGDTVSGQIRPPKEGERYFALIKVEAVNFESPDQARDKLFFENLTPLYPQERFILETTPDLLSGRVLDLMAPDRQGPARPDRRAAADRQDDAAAEHRAVGREEPPGGLPHRPAHRRAAGGSDRHAAIGQWRGHLLDVRRAGTAPRAGGRDGHREGQAPGRAQERRADPARLDYPLARAYNSVIPPSGKVLSGGLDSNALQKPKRFFGAARNIEEGGSLTIIATALIDTGSRMDDVIFEEFKGTGNMEIHLDRKLTDKRVFPSIDMQKSGTRKEELLLPREDLNRVWVLRKVLNPLSAVEAMELLLDKMGKAKSNAEFLSSMQKMG